MRITPGQVVTKGLAVAIMALAFWTCTSALDMPEVLVNDMTGQCVEVRDPAAAHEGRAPYTCATVPERHISTPTSRH